MALSQKKTNYNQKDNQELFKVLQNKEKELLETGISIAQNKTKNFHAANIIRKDIARIKTAMRLKKLTT